MTGGFYGAATSRSQGATRGTRCVLVLAAALAWPVAHAQTLAQAWERAIATEPSVAAARAGQAAAVQRTEQARGSLLPQVDASGNRQLNHRSFIQNTTNPLTGEPSPEVAERYYSSTAQVNITQPLWRPQNWAALAQARESQQQAAWQTLASEQELQVKFMSAWFDVMGARDNVLQATAQVEAMRQQREVMERGLGLGTHSEVQSSEAAARHEQAIAERAAAGAELDAKLALLEQLTGPLPGFTPPQLRVEDASLLFAPLAPLAAWLARAEDGNGAIRAAERAVAAAREEVRKQAALNSPTLDLIARHARVLQGSGNTPGQAGYRSREHGVGLQLNVPIFSGGTNTAKMREALAMVQKAEAELDGARRNAIAQAQQAWASAQAAQARSQAAQHAIRASELAIRAATTGQGTGLKTLLEELQARQQLAQARRDRQRAHYDRVVALARLHAATGDPADVFIGTIQSLLATPNH